ncbi:MAG: tetratricopeptide repeat protein [Akkermansiaceae bacterium]|nr:tetratricopeptide repeat protein [Akkermansiaceae bacterium]
MKSLTIFLSALFGIFFIAPPSIARDVKRGGGGSGGSSPSRSSAPAQRSPMTGSKIERPQPKPQPKPVARPAPKPVAKPAAKPAERPSVQKPSVQKPSVQAPSTRPDSRPGNNKPEMNRPNTLPGNTKPELNRPDNRPSLDRPANNRPATLPGMVSYPNRPDNGKPNRPNIGGSDRPNIGGNDGNKINVGDRNNIHIENVNVGRHNVGLNRPSTLPAKSRDWDNNKWGGNRGVWGNNNNVNVNINNNFRYNNNFAYRPNYWGARPWWGAGSCHGWHHGHWNYGYNSYYYGNRYYYNNSSFASGFMWGIGVWSLGNLIYDMGYQSYRNPYPAPAVQNTYITYAQPVSVAAAANPPGDEAATDIAETKSNEALERSRDAFKKGDYITASKAVDEAIGYTPGDVTLHEYRALVFFALGKYSDAAGILNPVLASGPGWSWDTMIGFYNGSEAYNEQLRKLESYVRKSPDKADARFLLGYQYMVCGHMDKAYEQFAKATELQPADSISRQLRDLTKSSIPDGGASETESPAAPAPVPVEKLVGTWVSDRGDAGKVTFTLTEGGDYTWAFMNAGKSTDLKGTYGLDDQGLLVLTSDDTQMVSAIEMKDSSKLHFTLVGAPDGDPGLDFTKN